ncbi:helix-turn-helix domain-containing protein [Citrifermentans bremense]|uniref:helix-turn-helix domain-containing protein n=1 Tax=Citrifermentans bremense TaxID=60035 RepID=UPI000417404D|nr:helix-turn-helix transcriptional regulator [Citrifermentans bremense]
MTPEKAFGETIKELRTLKKMSQETVAFSSELDRSYISQVECGLRSPTLSTVFKIAAAIGVPVSEIMHTVERTLEKE